MYLKEILKLLFLRTAFYVLAKFVQSYKTKDYFLGDMENIEQSENKKDMEVIEKTNLKKDIKDILKSYFLKDMEVLSSSYLKKCLKKLKATNHLFWEKCKDIINLFEERSPEKVNQRARKDFLIALWSSYKRNLIIIVKSKKNDSEGLLIYSYKFDSKNEEWLSEKIPIKKLKESQHKEDQDLKEVSLEKKNESQPNEDQVLQAVNVITFNKNIDLFQDKSLGCNGNPEHRKFKNVSNISLTDLPEGYQYVELLDLVKSMADLTVMIEVTNTQSKDDVTNYTGTGKIDAVLRHEKDPCCCEKCVTSESQRSQTWIEIKISSSDNIVNNTLNAKNFKCTLFYDDQSQPNNIKVVRGTQLEKYDVMANLVTFKCATCDSELVEKLSGKKKTFDDSYNLLLDSNNYNNTIKSEQETLVVVVSHPHGKQKQVFFEKWPKDAVNIRQIYNRTICNGSSGAYILKLRAKKQRNTLGQTKSKTLNKKQAKKYGKSIPNTTTPKDDRIKQKHGEKLDMKRAGLSNKYHIDTSASVEDSLTSVSCKRYPDHSVFKDVSTDVLCSLPRCYQHSEMLDLIKSVADLTVMVENNHSLKSQGTGKIENVCIKNDIPCPCLKCQLSESPASRNWCEIKIMTSAQLFIKNNDIKNFKCTLFFDEERKTIKENNKLKYLHGYRIEIMSTKRGVCKFTCATCDMDLVERLDRMLNTFEDNWKKAYDKYVHTVRAEKERLAVIVSHPHGCKKYVSVGKWYRDRANQRIIHNVPTCSGSCGAYILVPNFDVVDETFTHDNILCKSKSGKKVKTKKSNAALFNSNKK